jgi:hypothetical protein
MAFQYGLSGPGILDAPMYEGVLFYLSETPARLEEFKKSYFESHNPEEFAKQYLDRLFAEVNGLRNAERRRLARRTRQRIQFGNINTINAPQYNRRAESWIHHHNVRYPQGRRLWTPNLTENVPPQLPTSNAARDQARALMSELHPNPENYNFNHRKRKTRKQKTRKNR